MNKGMHIAAGLGLTVFMGLGFLWIYNLTLETEAISVDGELAQRGLSLATEQGCVACHTLDGSPGIGPSWLGMYGKTETLIDGSTVLVDDDYIRESINNPGAKQVEGYQNLMIRYFLSENEMEAVLEFARQLGVAN